MWGELSWTNKKHKKLVLEISLKSLAGPDRVQVFDLASLEFCQTWSQRNHCVIITLTKKREERVNLKNCPPRINLSNGPPTVSHFIQTKIDIFLFFSFSLRIFKNAIKCYNNPYVLGSHCVAHIVSCWNHISLGPFKKLAIINWDASIECLLICKPFPSYPK